MVTFFTEQVQQIDMLVLQCVLKAEMGGRDQGISP